MGQSSPFTKLIYSWLGRIMYRGTSRLVGQIQTFIANSFSNYRPPSDNMKFSKRSLLSLAAISTPALACVQLSLNFNLCN